MVDQPDGWTGGTIHVDMPVLTNLRLGPFERMGFQKGNSGSFLYVGDFYLHEFWRFVFLQQKVGEYALTFVDYPPMQGGRASILRRPKPKLRRRLRR
jgi:hypothetical protein